MLQEDYVLSCTKLPNYLPKLLYHFAFPPGMNQSFFCFIYLPGSEVVISDFNHCSKDVVVFKYCINCNSLSTYDVEHVFTCIFAIYIFYLVRYLFRPFACVFFFLLLDFESSLYILGTSPLLDMCLANIFSQTLASLFIVLTVPWQSRSF